MKKFILKVVLILFLFVPMLIVAQDFQGKAYYQTKRNVDFEMENNHVNDEQVKMIQEMLKKQFEKSFVLTFDKEASIYKEEEELDKPTSGSSGVNMIMVGGSSGNEKLYKNTKTKAYAREQNLFGKPFLIKGNLKSLDWKLEDESKMIGKYLCFKATAVREVRKMEFVSENTDGERRKEVKDQMAEHTVTAWYTSDIPVSHGPDNYWGLPGLIMELNVDKTQYVCNKIVMNSQDKIEIKEPTKGEVITSEKFNKLAKKKIEEMRNNRGRQGRGDGNSFRFQIGG